MMNVCVNGASLEEAACSTQPDLELSEAREIPCGMGPLAFWFLNHELDQQELVRQIRELKEKGFSGFFLHPRGGLKVPYGSDSWKDVILFCIREARRLGMEAWLYDEDPYPSGNAGGRVTLEHPEYCATELVPTICSVAGPGSVTVDLAGGPLIAAYLVHENGISRIDSSAGLIRSEWRQSFLGSSYYPPYDAEGSPHWRAETIAPHYQIVLNNPHSEAWVVAFTRRTPYQNPWGTYTDVLNPDAVELFLRYTHDSYASWLGDEERRAVPGIFTDEMKMKGRLPWSGLVPHWFREVSGQDFFEALPYLAVDLGPRTPFFRWAYRKALAHGFRASMVEPMVEKCRDFGWQLTGHISPEEDPVGQTIYAPGLMGILGQMDIPGTDLIGAAVGGAENPLLHLSPKVASSAAHGTGKRFVACEAFAVCDWSQDLASLSRATHWLYALGVNRLVTHGQFYSIDGLRKREAPPSQFFQASYWEHFGKFSKMVEFLSRELSQGRHRAPVLLYYPEESFMALVSGRASEGHGEDLVRHQLGETVKTLLYAGYDFDLVDEEFLQKAEAEGKRVRLSGEFFEAVVVPGLFLAPSSWERLQALCAAGVPVFYLEQEVTLLIDPPVKVSTHSLQEHEETLLEALQNAASPLWKANGTLLAHLRETENGPILFLCNNSQEDFCGPVELVFPGPYEVCLPQEGYWRGAGLHLHLKLGAGLGVLVRQQQVTSTSAQGFHYDSWQPLAVEGGLWTSRPLSENCVILHEFRFLTRNSGSGEVPSIREMVNAPVVDFLSPSILHFPVPDSGEDRYYFASFDWKGPMAPLRLVYDTDLLESDAIFYVNGEQLPPPCRRRTYDPMNQEVDITSLVKPGRNSFLWLQKARRDRVHLPFPYDAVRLFGDIHVEFPTGRTVPPLLSQRPAGYPEGFPVSPTIIGHPHYGGIIEYELPVHFSVVPEGRLALRLKHVFETMEVRVNGVVAGYLWCKPFQMEIPASLMHVGENRVALRCSCSPANYLQGLQRPAGFLGHVEWGLVG